MTQFTLKYEPKQIKHAIKVLRVYNPGPFFNYTDAQMEQEIEQHIVTAFGNADWEKETSYYSATAGYWLNFIRFPNSDEPLLVDCTVLIDPYIMILDPDLNADPVYVINQKQEQEGF